MISNTTEDNMIHELVIMFLWKQITTKQVMPIYTYIYTYMQYNIYVM